MSGRLTELGFGKIYEVDRNRDDIDEMDWRELNPFV